MGARTWISNSSTDYNIAANWDPAFVPTSESSLIFNERGSADCVFSGVNGAALTVKSLQVDQSYQGKIILPNAETTIRERLEDFAGAVDGSNGSLFGFPTLRIGPSPQVTVETSQSTYLRALKINMDATTDFCAINLRGALQVVDIKNLGNLLDESNCLVHINNTVATDFAVDLDVMNTHVNLEGSCTFSRIDFKGPHAFGDASATVNPLLKIFSGSETGHSFFLHQNVDVLLLEGANVNAMQTGATLNNAHLNIQAKILGDMTLNGLFTADLDGLQTGGALNRFEFFGAVSDQKSQVNVHSHHNTVMEISKVNMNIDVNASLQNLQARNDSLIFNEGTIGNVELEGTIVMINQQAGATIAGIREVAGKTATLRLVQRGGTIGDVNMEHGIDVFQGGGSIGNINISAQNTDLLNLSQDPDGQISSLVVNGFSANPIVLNGSFGLLDINNPDLSTTMSVNIAGMQTATQEAVFTGPITVNLIEVDFNADGTIDRTGHLDNIIVNSCANGQMCQPSTVSLQGATSIETLEFHNNAKLNYFGQSTIGTLKVIANIQENTAPVEIFSEFGKGVETFVAGASSPLTTVDNSRVIFNGSFEVRNLITGNSDGTQGVIHLISSMGSSHTLTVIDSISSGGDSVVFANDTVDPNSYLNLEIGTNISAVPSDLLVEGALFVLSANVSMSPSSLQGSLNIDENSNINFENAGSIRSIEVLSGKTLVLSNSTLGEVVVEEAISLHGNILLNSGKLRVPNLRLEGNGAFTQNGGEFIVDDYIRSSENASLQQDGGSMTLLCNDTQRTEPCYEIRGSALHQNSLTNLRVDRRTRVEPFDFHVIRVA